MITRYWESGRQYIPWLLLFVLIIIPTLIGTAVLAIRSGLFRIQAETITNDQLKVFWTFAGVAVAAAVSLTGYLITSNQHKITERRLALDTTVSGLKLITNQDGSGYAPKAAIAGALATLIYLHQPIIAMRSLSAVWREGAIDSASAVWLISEILITAENTTQLEAALLLNARSDSLCGDDPGGFNWPASFLERWNPSLPTDARLWILHALLRMLISKPYSWWVKGAGDGYIVTTLDEALLKDPDLFVKKYAAKAVLILLKSADAADSDTITSVHGDKGVDEIRERSYAALRSNYECMTHFDDTIDALRNWVPSELRPDRDAGNSD